MHAFLIISQLPFNRQRARDRLLKNYSIDKFDVVSIAASEGSIENIRLAQKRLFLKTEPGKHRLLHIEEVDKLSLEAQNAILKTIEEPPVNTVVILETDNKNSILPTILSRSLIIEDFTHEEVSIRQQKSLDDFWAKTLATRLTGQMLEIASQIIMTNPDRESLDKWVKEQIIYLRKIMLVKTAHKHTPGKLTPLDVVEILKQLLFVKKYIRFNVNSKLLIDNFFLSMLKIISPASQDPALRS